MSETEKKMPAEVIQTVTIPEPESFYCDGDEDQFFAWLKSLPAVRSIKGGQDGLAIEYVAPIDRLSFYELVGLLSRYQLDLSSLRPLCESQKDSWFSDQNNYWYSAVHEPNRED